MARKKIIWLCSWYPGKVEPFNGDFIQRHAQAAALFNDIHVIHVYGDSSGLFKKTTVEIADHPGLKEEIIYFKKSTSAWGRFWGHYKLLFLYKNAMRNYLRKNGKPDLVHVNVPIKAGIFGIWLKRRSRVPYVVTEHWGIYNEIADQNYTTRSRVFQHYTKKIIDMSSRFISVSRYLAEGVNRLVTKKKYEVVPNVVNTDLFSYKERLPGFIFRFIHVSNMVKLKNVEGILKAFKSLLNDQPNAELVMVGNTNDFYQQYAAELAIPSDRIFFRGEIPYNEVAQEMQQADCLLLFSNIENSPCVIGEALCCGLPVLATKVGGIPELLDSSNSLLIDAQDEMALKLAMDTMINSQAKFNRQEISKAAVSRFRYDTVGKRLDEIYEEVRKGDR